MRDLMCHTAGLHPEANGKSLAKDRYGAAGLLEPGQSNADMAAKLACLPPQKRPGAVWDFSKSTDVLRYIVDVVGKIDDGSARAPCVVLRQSGSQCGCSNGSRPACQNDRSAGVNNSRLLSERCRRARLARRSLRSCRTPG